MCHGTTDFQTVEDTTARFLGLMGKPASPFRNKNVAFFNFNFRLGVCLKDVDILHFHHLRGSPMNADLSSFPLTPAPWRKFRSSPVDTCCHRSSLLLEAAACIATAWKTCLFLAGCAVVRIRIPQELAVVITDVLFVPWIESSGACLCCYEAQRCKCLCLRRCWHKKCGASSNSIACPFPQALIHSFFICQGQRAQRERLTAVKSQD